MEPGYQQPRLGDWEKQQTEAFWARISLCRNPNQLSNNDHGIEEKPKSH
jgi:hypothetical protein